MIESSKVIDFFMERYLREEGESSHVGEKVLAVAKQVLPLLSNERKSELSKDMFAKVISFIESVDHSNQEVSLAEQAEQILLTLALAVKKSTTGLSGQTRGETATLDLIFGEESSSIIDAGVVGLYVVKSFPQIWVGIGFGGENPDQYFAKASSDQLNQVDSLIFQWARANLTGGGQILRVGHSYRQSQRLQEENFKVLGTSRSRQTLFGALAIKENDLVVLAHDDPTGQDELHEKNHLKPGLMAGSLGYALDEGMTEHLAIVEGDKRQEHTAWNPWKNRQSDLFDTAGRYKSYLDERRLLAEITDNGKNELYQFLVRRYEQGDLNSAISLAAQLINRFGFDGYLQLYLAAPDVFGSDRGVLQVSSKVAKNLRGR